MGTRLKVLDWCDSVLDSQLDNLQKVIWQLKKGKAAVSVARLKMKQERKEKDDSDSRKRSCIARRDTVH